MGFLITQTVNMVDPKIYEKDLGQIAYKGDAHAHTWLIEISNGTNWINGANASVEFILPNGTPASVTAEVDGSTINAVFPSTVYNYTGVVKASMRVRKGTEITTIATLRFFVVDSASI